MICRLTALTLCLLATSLLSFSSPCSAAASKKPRATKTQKSKKKTRKKTQPATGMNIGTPIENISPMDCNEVFTHHPFVPDQELRRFEAEKGMFESPYVSESPVYSSKDLQRFEDERNAYAAGGWIPD